MALVIAAGSNVGGGAVLTLVLPVGCLLVVLALWFAFMRRSHRDE
jgi:hypothetical protein